MDVRAFNGSPDDDYNRFAEPSVCPTCRQELCECCASCHAAPSEPCADDCDCALCLRERAEALHEAVR